MRIAHLHTYTDEDVMELFQGGYDEAFTEIVTRYRERIHQFIYRYTRNHLDSEDIAQETFFRVYRSKHSYEPIARLSTWLYTIANNLIRTHHRKASRHQTVSIFEGDEPDKDFHLDLIDVANTPDITLHENVMVEYVQKALKQIPAEFSEILIMRDVQSFTYEEIMEITGLPMGTVKSRINRARTRIQVILKQRLN